jgi:hypothetical protein
MIFSFWVCGLNATSPANWRGELDRNLLDEDEASLRPCGRGPAAWHPLCGSSGPAQDRREWLSPCYLHGAEFRAHLVNYADDFVILSRGCAAEALAWTRAAMTKLGLTLNEAKTSVKDASTEGFDFLGYTLGPKYAPKGGQKYLGARRRFREFGGVGPPRIFHGFRSRKTGVSLVRAPCAVWRGSGERA